MMPNFMGSVGLLGTIPKMHKTNNTYATSIAPDNAGKAVRRQGLKTVVVATRITWRLVEWVVRPGEIGLAEAVLSAELDCEEDSARLWMSGMCEIVTRTDGFRKIALLGVIQQVWWWPVVGEVSKYSWQQRLISVIIKWCRIKGRPMETLKVED
ncbi:hypothetical protein DEO72_LG5g537 [Vigna unguiculata]|uniref:Uncharacterized protein n=1 Tax=Vigna unguiculata TaxID=3917 RepID=A0A4D6LVK0_VIGUN|nr:hypothetical protein DEO72_LG5g537 [Vigna unguiculata]